NKINILLIFFSYSKRNEINKYTKNINFVFKEKSEEEKQTTGSSFTYQSVYYFYFRLQSF
ncbi:hypothetical protein AM501_10215, partial [Aneurinibacillus migulanus]|uniref:hypothetical protein n=1 Tax=Aneurinibacillus migulanus TaxID=47500 RepID=UPI0006CC6211